MRSPVVPTGRLVRAVERLAKRDANATHAVRIVLEMLAEDAFQPALQTHQLKGD